MAGTISPAETSSPTVLPAFRPIQVAPPDGPWALDCVSSDKVLVRWGRVVYADNFSNVPINGFFTEFGIKEGTTYINLKIRLNNGIAQEATIEASTRAPVYRAWNGDGRTIETQTELNACLASIHPAPEFVLANTYLYLGATKSYGVYRCCYTDLMIYKACDGLILLPAPFSLP